jgi:nitroimidazol reductase NimA-like FMN-containing flavoprotein (pyridoxamine 5'-phosphate oxidase superfamily)
MRKANREITDFDEIVGVMQDCGVCRLALNGPDGTPYIVPLNFGLAVDGNAVALYFHSALEGLKLDLIRRDNRAAFEMDCKHQLLPAEEGCRCSFAYESVMGAGTISLVDGEEKVRGLDLIMAHYHLGENAHYSPAVVQRTAVYRLDVKTITGKRNVPK